MAVLRVVALPAQGAGTLPRREPGRVHCKWGKLGLLLFQFAKLICYQLQASRYITGHNRTSE